MVEEANKLYELAKAIYEFLSSFGQGGNIALTVIAAILTIAAIYIVAKVSSISDIDLIFMKKNFEIYKVISTDLILAIVFFVSNMILISDPAMIILAIAGIIIFSILLFVGFIANKILSHFNTGRKIRTLYAKMLKDQFPYVLYAVLLSPVIIFFLISYLNIPDSALDKKVIVYCIVTVCETLFMHLCMYSSNTGESYIEITENGEKSYFLSKPNNDIILCGDNRTQLTSEKIKPLKIEKLMEGDVTLRRLPYVEKEFTIPDTSTYELKNNIAKIDKFISSNKVCDVDLAVFDGSRTLMNYIKHGDTLYLYLQKEDILRNPGSAVPLSISILSLLHRQYFTSEGHATLYTRNTEDYNKLINEIPALKEKESDVRNSNHIVKFEINKDKTRLDDILTKTSYVYYPVSQQPITQRPAENTPM